MSTEIKVVSMDSGKTELFVKFPRDISATEVSQVLDAYSFHTPVNIFVNDSIFLYIPREVPIGDVTLESIISDVYNVVTQSEFLLLASLLDTKSSFATAVSCKNWQMAKLKIMECFTEGSISEDLRDRILSVIP